MSPSLPRPRKATGARAFLKTILARSYPRIIGQMREKSWLFFDLFMPIVSIIAYVFVYRALHAPEEYVGFVVMGGATIAFWLNVIWSMSSQLYWEKETGNLALYIMAPASLMAILLGMAFGGMLATSLRAVLILLIGSALFHVSFQVSGVLPLLAVFGLTMVALYGMGMMLASLFLLLGREAWHFGQLAQEPIYLLSGFYFPVRSLGPWVAAGASLLPLTLGLDAMRQLSFRPGVTRPLIGVNTEIALLFLLAVIFLIAARLLLAHMERLAIREGRLTQSRA